jgi:hypothetical protein
MIKKLIDEWKYFFTKHDWMLHKQVFIAILFIPVIYISGIVLYTVQKNNYLDTLYEEVVFAEKLLAGVQSAKSAEKYGVNENYVKDVLGDLSFLSVDRKNLALICSEVSDQNLFPKVKQRLSFLQNGNNKMDFISENLESGLLWSIVHPVQMNCMDIRKLITLVEGEPIGKFYPSPRRPKLHFLNLNINKLNKDQNNLYTVDLNILQKR